MCKAIEDMRMLERSEGALEKAKAMAQKLYAAGMPEDKIAEIAEVSVMAVKQWLHPVVA